MDNGPPRPGGGRQSGRGDAPTPLSPMNPPPPASKKHRAGSKASTPLPRSGDSITDAADDAIARRRAELRRLQKLRAASYSSSEPPGSLTPGKSKASSSKYVGVTPDVVRKARAKLGSLPPGGAAATGGPPLGRSGGGRAEGPPVASSGPPIGSDGSGQSLRSRGIEIPAISAPPRTGNIFGGIKPDRISSSSSAPPTAGSAPPKGVVAPPKGKFGGYLRDGKGPSQFGHSRMAGRPGGGGSVTGRAAASLGAVPSNLHDPFKAARVKEEAGESEGGDEAKETSSEESKVDDTEKTRVDVASRRPSKSVGFKTDPPATDEEPPASDPTACQPPPKRVDARPTPNPKPSAALRQAYELSPLLHRARSEERGVTILIVTVVDMCFNHSFCGLTFSTS